MGAERLLRYLRPVAAVRCDIVFTERFWVDIVNHTGLPIKYQTTVITRPADLVAKLVFGR